jgi:hypothetical protein
MHPIAEAKKETTALCSMFIEPCNMVISGGMLFRNRIQQWRYFARVGIGGRQIAWQITESRLAGLAKYIFFYSTFFSTTYQRVYNFKNPILYPIGPYTTYRLLRLY